MKDLRIVFMGTPDFAVGVLKMLVDHKYTIIGVITAPDKPAGRGRKLNQSAVKKYAIEKNLPVLQPTNLKDSIFLEQLKNWKADVQIVVAFRMLPKVVWEMPKKGTFNLHASLLPSYRGAAPIHWAIINGEKKTGVTTFFIDEKIDTGAIILKDSIAIDDNDTVGTLHDKLMTLGASLVLKTVDLLENKTVSTQKQSDKEVKLAPKLTKENTRIDWQQDLDTIYNFIRGLNPFPAAWTIIDNNNSEIKAQLYKVSKEKVDHHLKIGELQFFKKELKVAVKGGYILIHEIKLAGRKKMDAISLLNGFSFNENARVV